MSMILLATCAAMRKTLSPQMFRTLAETTARWARPLVARGSALEATAAPSGAAPRGRLGARFDRDGEQVFRA